MKHELKVYPEFYVPLVIGVKRFEIRRADRNFVVGDVLLLREWLKSPPAFTGRSCQFIVTYVLGKREFPALLDGYVVLSLDGFKNNVFIDKE